MTDPLTTLSREGSVSGLTWESARRLKRRGQARGWISTIRPEGDDLHRLVLLRKLREKEVSG